MIAVRRVEFTESVLHCRKCLEAKIIVIFKISADRISLVTFSGNYAFLSGQNFFCRFELVGGREQIPHHRNQDQV